MKTADYFENGWLKEEYLWPLRQQIVLGSMYVSDYYNHFGISEQKVCDFFISFWNSYVEELAKEDNLLEQACASVTKDPADPDKYERDCQAAYLELCHKRYDNEKTLKEWYSCFVDDSPLPPKRYTVDIFWTFHRTVEVIAEDDYDAEDIVEKMMQHRELPVSSFEPDDDDWELEATLQEED
jgi:hypothetical protein